MIFRRETGYFTLYDFDQLEIKVIPEFLMSFCGENMQLLFGCKWKELDFSQLENEVIDEKLKEVLSNLSAFLVDEEVAKRENAENKKFIDDRTVFINDKWELPWTAPNNEVKDTIWYRPRTKEEIIRALRLNQEFHCIVLKEESDFDSYHYSLGCVETEEGSALVIIAKNEVDLLQHVLPKLKKIVDITTVSA
ncbi:hypothetical protein ACFYU8_11040 [Brevibacillus sp. NPDC003359]|uniref:hypothetical protein n=1 Tax=unclassified Brevibacillus TaxID=2684853 RepID=UPI00369C0C22